MSPDLNPIERNHRRRQIEQRQPSNLYEVKDVVATEWENIQPNLMLQQSSLLHAKAFGCCYEKQWLSQKIMVLRYT